MRRFTADGELLLGHRAAPVDRNHSNNSAPGAASEGGASCWRSTFPLPHHNESRQHGDDVTETDAKGKEPEYKTSDWTVRPMLSASITSETAAKTSAGCSTIGSFKS